MRVCEVDGCDRKHFGRGYCQMHYCRWRATGDVHTVRAGHRFGEVDPAQRLSARSVPRGDCLVYAGGRPQRSGHRAMGFRGRYVGVHRVAWILANGDIPEGISVLHRCDVPDCINVNHLFLGTVAENNADRDRKGRHIPLHGSKNGFAKLSEYQIIEIRDLLARGVTQRQVAAQYGVSQATVWAIKSGRSWGHVQQLAAAR